MKPDPTEQPSWTWPYPQSWTQVYAVITTMLLGFLGIVYLADCLKAVLP